jgi:hypothetical protein
MRPQPPSHFGLVLIVAGALLAGCGLLNRVHQQVAFGARTAAEIHQATQHPQYAAMEAKLRAEGIPTRLADIFQKPPAQSLNAAPLYLRLQDKVPNRASPDESIATSLNSTTPGLGALAAARRFLAQYQSVVTLAEAAARRPLCVIPRQDNGSDPAALMFPELAAMRRATRIITIKSLVMAHDGKGLDAVHEQSLGFPVARHAESDAGTLIPYLVAVACDAITLRGMQKIMTESKGDPAVAMAVEASVAKNWKRPSGVTALEHECAFGNAEIRYLLKQGPAALAGVSGSNPGSLAQMNNQSWNALIDMNGSTYLDMMDRTIAAAKLPYPRSNKALDLIAAEITDDDPKYLVVSILYPIASKSDEKAIENQADVDVTRAAAAVFVYRGKYVTYPPTLAQAMSTVPLDPLDGKPLRYRRDGAGFVIGPTVGYDGKPLDAKNRHATVYRYP